MDLGSPQSRAVIGASADAGLESDSEGGELPMTVWLRGDEPFAGDFALDADKVMAELGIKRSRLTQISGRELRVGRIRRGRYIAPVYRQVDVETYKSWTRATASHVKSSSVLHEAAAALKDESLRVAAALEAATAASREDVHQAVRQGLSETFGRLTAAVEDLGREAARRDDERAHADARLLARLDAQNRAIEAQAKRLAAQDAQLMVLARGVGELTSLMRLQREDGATAREDLLTSFDALGELIADLRLGQAALASALHAPRAKGRGAKRPRIKAGSSPAPQASASGKSHASRRFGIAASPRRRRPRP